ncbi:DUF2961 domain-containing protein [Gemmatimonadota bacterium]
MLAFIAGTEIKAWAQYPPGKDVMELARRLYLEDLAFPKGYEAGKYTAYGNPGMGGEKTVVELDGPGTLTRIWTTQMHENDIMQLYIYVDGGKEPVLAGPARAIAAAAEKLSCPAVPWGGFLDGKSVSLYLPIPFKKHIRIAAEYHQDLLDGPYWQVDYKKDIVSEPFAWKQQSGPQGIEIVPMEEEKTLLQTTRKVYKSLEQEVTITSWPVNIQLQGPVVIRAIHINSNYLNNFVLRMAFDAEGGYGIAADRMDDVEFQVDAPLKYLISNFQTAGIELNGTTASIYFPMPVKKEALIQLQYLMDEKEFHSKYPATITIEYEESPANLQQMLYFHAKASTEVSNGYQDFEVLNVRGQGHFAGVHLFDTSHDHGGGDNIFFDAGTSTAGQLHGICAEDYFHHAYMRIGVSAPYVHCPTHSSRCRHHLEMPIPFQQSFTFNWGSFAGVMPKAVAIWYQKELSSPLWDELTYRVTGPFKLEQFDGLAPGGTLPDSVHFRKTNKIFARKSWQHLAQNRFVDLCHAYRQYANTIPPSSGDLEHDCCFVADSKIWAANDADTEFLIGCDDRIRVYLNDGLIGESPGSNEPGPFRQFSVKAKLKAGVNSVRVVAANTTNFNWKWSGFSLVMKNGLLDGQLLYLY